MWWRGLCTDFGERASARSSSVLFLRFAAGTCGRAVALAEPAAPFGCEGALRAFVLARRAA
ncbi:MAG: hypothetical protein ABS49_01245 [Erythrobacter sp. SCN 62-14]|nr:MAG: hypothetical protein ABS49_01245 [Erythrobacter sp. SCN 62-14]